MRATAMSLTATWNLHTRSQHKQKCPLCDLMKDVNYFTCPMVLVEESNDLDRYSRPDMPPERTCSLSPFRHRTYSASFYMCANGSLVSWFLMMADSSVSWSKNVNLSSLFILDANNDISVPERTIPKAHQQILKNEKADVCARSLRVNHAQATGSPVSFSGNSEHSYACSCENPPNPLSNKSRSTPEISDLDKDSYWHSLFNLQSEEGEWISDFRSSSPFSTKSDSSTEASDLEGVTYWDSLLSLEEVEDCEWISGSKTELEYFDFPSLCCNGCGEPELLLQTHDVGQVITNEPLFWPLQEEFIGDSEKSWTLFCISPRKHVNLLGTPAKSSASKEGKLKPRKGRTRGIIFGKQGGDEAECRSRSETSRRSKLYTSSSAKIAPLGKIVPREVPMIKPLSAGKNSTSKDLVLNRVVPSERGYFALDRELPIETLVGLQEFDGHEGLDSEFNGNVLILDE